MTTERRTRNVSECSYSLYAWLGVECHCSLNTKQLSAKSAMVKAVSGHSAPKSGMVMAIAAIPVALPMQKITDYSSLSTFRSKNVMNAVYKNSFSTGVKQTRGVHNENKLGLERR